MKNKDIQNKNIEKLTDDILGNAFVGNLLDHLLYIMLKESIIK